MKLGLLAAVGALVLLLCGGPVAAQQSADSCERERASFYLELEQGRRNAEPLIACHTRKIESGSLSNAQLVNEYSVRADVFLSINQFERAVEDNTRALALMKSSSFMETALSQRCFSLGMLSRFAEALRDCDEAIVKRPGFFLFWANRATVYLKMGENGKALKDFNEALRLLSAYPAEDAAIFRYGRGMAKRRLGDRPGGDADIAAALVDSPRAREHYAGWGITD